MELREVIPSFKETDKTPSIVTIVTCARDFIVFLIQRVNFLEQLCENAGIDVNSNGNTWNMEACAKRSDQDGVSALATPAVNLNANSTTAFQQDQQQKEVVIKKEKGVSKSTQVRVMELERVCLFKHSQCERLEKMVTALKHSQTQLHLQFQQQVRENQLLHMGNQKLIAEMDRMRKENIQLRQHAYFEQRPLSNNMQDLDLLAATNNAAVAQFPDMNLLSGSEHPITPILSPILLHASLPATSSSLATTTAPMGHPHQLSATSIHQLQQQQQQHHQQQQQQRTMELMNMFPNADAARLAMEQRYLLQKQVALHQQQEQPQHVEQELQQGQQQVNEEEQHTQQGTISVESRNSLKREREDLTDSPIRKRRSIM